MRNVIVTFMLLLLATVLTGMGMTGGGPGGTVPDVKEEIHARLVDRTGTSIELDRFSVDGEVFIEGERGSGTMSVFFNRLKAIRFGEISGEKVLTTVELKDGSSIDLKVSKRAVFYGDTGFGAYSIRAREVKEIRFP